jgi:ATP-dependent Clp protease ATP-binding subunit ClpX
VVATLQELDEAALIEILIEPKNALIKQYQKLFSMEGVELEVPLGAAGHRPQGAQAQDRRARPAFDPGEQVLLDTMYDLPTLENVSKVVIDESTIEGAAPSPS